MYKYRMLVADLDGTALDEKGRITPRTRRVLRQVAGMGVYLVIATGRTLPFLQDVCKGLPLDAPQIFDNGAGIANGDTGHILRRQSIPRKLVLPTLEILRQEGLHRVWYHHGCIYVDPGTPRAHDWYHPSVQSVIEVKKDVASLGDMSCLKLGAVGEPDVLRAKRGELESLFAGKLNVTQSASFLLEFLHPQASKGNALRFIAKRLGISLREVVAIGDGYNDVDMFRLAGLSIAMGNASQEVKDAADLTTGRNSEEGVADAIERFILPWLK